MLRFFRSLMFVAYGIVSLYGGWTITSWYFWAVLGILASVSLLSTTIAAKDVSNLENW